MRWSQSIFGALSSLGLMQTGIRIDDHADQNPVVQASDYGLKILYQSPEPIIDIVAVHGLDGHWKDSWTAENGVFWLHDLLPERVPGARIMSFGYDARTRASTPVSNSFIDDHANDLLGALTIERERSNAETRPIVFIAYSLGGLVVKSALLQSDLSRPGHLENYKALKASTSAVFFLGVPHQGGQGVTLGEIMARLLSSVMHTTRNVLHSIEEHSEWLYDLQKRYNAISRDFKMVFFYEIYKMPVPVYGHVLIVPKYSAVIQGAVDSEEVPLAADHSTMAKYSSADDPNFQKVVQRLEKLVKQAGSHSQAAWEPPMFLRDNQAQSKSAAFAPFNPLEFRLPLSIDHLRNSRFIGRDWVMSQLDSTLLYERNDQQMNVFLLYGAGGIGKTQIAIEYLYRRRAEFTAAFWLDGRSEDKLLTSIRQAVRRILNHYESNGLHTNNLRYRQLSRSLDVLTGDDPLKKTQDENLKPISPVEAFHGWLTHDHNRRWLIVLDNVDDLESFDFRKYIPRTTWGGIVITSRRSDLAPAWDKSVEVEEMNEDDALELLQRTSGVSCAVNSTELLYARRIVQTLGYFPLAVTQAGAFIAVHKPSQPMQTYLSLYKAQPTAFLGQTGARAAWNYRNDTVLTTWEVSFSAIERDSPHAARLLLLCGFLAADDIWEELLIGSGAATQGQQVLKSIHILLSYNLLKRKLSQKGVYMHPLVHLWARERLDPKAKSQFSHEAALLLFRAWKARSQGSDLETFETRAIPHVTAVLENCRMYCSHIEGSDWQTLQPPSIAFGHSQIWYVAKAVNSWYLWIRSLLEDAMRLAYLYVVKEDLASQQTWELLHGLGHVFFDDSLAAQAYSWSLQEAWISVPCKHPAALAIAGDYANVLIQLRSFDLAYAWYNWLYQARKDVLGAHHPATMGALLGLGRVASGKGLHEEAIEHLTQAYRIREKVLGPDDYLTINAIGWTAWALCEAEKDELCLQWEEEKLKRQKRSTSEYASEPCGILATLDRIFVACWALKDFDKAADTLREAIDLQDTSGCRGLDRLGRSNTLVEMLESAGEYEAARIWYGKILEIARQLGKEEDVPLYQARLARILFRLQQYEDAIKMMDVALHVIIDWGCNTAVNGGAVSWSISFVINAVETTFQEILNGGMSHPEDIRLQLQEVLERRWWELWQCVKIKGQFCLQWLRVIAATQENPDLAINWLERALAYNDHSIFPVRVTSKICSELSDANWKKGELRGCIHWLKEQTQIEMNSDMGKDLNLMFRNDLTILSLLILMGEDDEAKKWEVEEVDVWDYCPVQEATTWKTMMSCPQNDTLCSKHQELVIAYLEENRSPACSNWDQHLGLLPSVCRAT